jgi:hypothetical protein
MELFWIWILVLIVLPPLLPYILWLNAELIQSTINIMMVKNLGARNLLV